MKDGVAILGVAGAGNFAELLGDGVPLAEHQAGQDRLMKLLVKRELSGEEAAVERRQGEFEIVGVESPGFLDGAGAGAGSQADVPHALDDGLDGFLGLGFNSLVGKDEQHVDVGIGEEIFSSIAAKGKQRDVQGGLTREGSTPHFNEDTVDYGGAAANGGGAVSGALAGLADKRHLPRILLPKIVNRECDWIHERWCEALPKQVRNC